MVADHHLIILMVRKKRREWMGWVMGCWDYYYQLFPIGSVCMVYMLTFGFFVDGKCYHIWHTYGSYGLWIIPSFPTLNAPVSHDIQSHLRSHPSVYPTQTSTQKSTLLRKFSSTKRTWSEINLLFIWNSTGKPHFLWFKRSNPCFCSLNTHCF